MGPFVLIAYRASASTAFAIEAAGIVGRLVHILLSTLNTVNERIVPPTGEYYPYTIK